jgi:predicted alpha/beta superfamily hydrolase
VVFSYDPGEAPVERVCLAGEFNGWSPDAWPMTRGPDGVFRREVDLAPGVYRYKFVVDGEWRADPKSPLREPHGYRNSVIVVGDVEPPDLSAPVRDAGAPPRLTKGRRDAFRIVPARELRLPAGLRPRPLYVYLPPSYEAAPERRYPVLYLHDGQNVWSDPNCCFGHGGWFLEETSERLWASGEVEEYILVGVANTPDRMKEYGTSDLLAARNDPYVRYLVEVVKPFVDSRYRTLPGPDQAALMGSSMGGLVSFVIALTHPEVFGKAACLSPSFWFEDGKGKTAFDFLEARGRRPVRLYLDSGTVGQGQDGAPKTRRMAAALRRAGWASDHALLHHVDEGAEHNERAWRARAEIPLRFLFGVEGER